MIGIEERGGLRRNPGIPDDEDPSVALHASIVEETLRRSAIVALAQWKVLKYRCRHGRGLTFSEARAGMTASVLCLVVRSGRLTGVARGSLVDPAARRDRRNARGL